MNRRVADEYEPHALLPDTPIVLRCFSVPGCTVCQVLIPRVSILLAGEFPYVEFAEVDCVTLPAQYQVFSVPVVLLFLQGRESLRWLHSFHSDELWVPWVRPYSQLFGEEA